MKENCYLKAMKQVDCFVISDHTHSTNLQTRHSIEFQENRHDEDHILKHICDPRSKEEVQATELSVTPHQRIFISPAITTIYN
jgi:hypothetical protein